MQADASHAALRRARPGVSVHELAVHASRAVRSKKETHSYTVPLWIAYKPIRDAHITHTHVHVHMHPGEQTECGQTCKDIFPITASVLKPGSDLNSRRIISYVPKSCGDTCRPLRAEAAPPCLDFYLLFTSSLASPIFQKPLAVRL